MDGQLLLITNSQWPFKLGTRSVSCVYAEPRLPTIHLRERAQKSLDVLAPPRKHGVESSVL